MISRVIWLIAFFAHFAQAQVCAPTPFEKQATDSISLLRAHPIWRDFPTRYLFAVREFEGTNPGFYAVTSEERETMIQNNLASSCAESNIVQSSEALVKMQGRYYAHCSASALGSACLEIPPFLKVFKALGKPVGIVGIERAHLEKVKKAIGEIPYSFIQLTIYDSIHEMFHEYQAEQKFKTAGPSISFAACMEQNREWAKGFEKEKRWWSNRIYRIHLNSKNPGALGKILTEYYSTIRPNQSDFPECDQALARYQFHEGVAHFAGSLALKRTGLASDKQLAAIDRAYLEVPFENHDAMGIYATGGSLSWLLYYLMGDEFIAEIEKSNSPYDIGLNILSQGSIRK